MITTHNVRFDINEVMSTNWVTTYIQKEVLERRKDS
jgi:hypothetical protein